MTDVGLGLVTSSTTHTTHMHTKDKNQQHNQHSLRHTHQSSPSLFTSASTSTSATTTPNTKGRITRAAAAAAAASAAKAAEPPQIQVQDKDKENKTGKKTGKMSSTITTAAVSSSSSSSHRSSNSTTPTSSVSHHHHHQQQAQYTRASHSSNYLQPPPQPHSHHTERYPHTRSSHSNTTAPTISHASSSSYTDSSLAVQYPSSSTEYRQERQDRIRGSLTRKRAASLITSELGDRAKRLSIDLDAARSGGSTRSTVTSGQERDTGAGGKKAGNTVGSGGASPEESRGATDLDSRSVSSVGGGSVGSVSGVHSTGGHSAGGSIGGGPPQRDLICLCTPAPKVPRPRNAFILYRQHHQARVVAENPGLANPEISKIIGEKWRAESDQHKGEWKQLAEEEKLHHQRKYPEYKYQPRRGNKNNPSGVPGWLGSARTSPTTPGAGLGGLGGLGGSGGIGGSGTGEHPGRCPNCGGRYIATPRTPSTPFGTAGSGSSKSTMHASEGRSSGQSAFNAGMDTPREMEHHVSSSSRSQQHYAQQDGGYRDHRASVSSQGGYQAYPNRDYHHTQTYHYPTPSHHQSYPAHPLYDMPQEYEVSTPTGTSSKRRRYDSTSMSYWPEREYALPSPTTPYGHGSNSQHPSVSGQYAVRPPSHYHQQQNPMSPTPLGHGHGHGHGQVMHHYPPPPPPTPSATLGGGGGTGSVPPTPRFAPATAGPPTSTATISGPASLAPSGHGRSPLSNTMGPPPRPPRLSVPGSSGSYHHGQQHPASGSRSGLSPVRMSGDDSVFDPSLRLPPLQTHLAHLPPNSPESGPSSGSGAGAGLLSAGGGSIGLGITYPGDHRDPRSASSSASHPYPRLTGAKTAGNMPTAASFPAPASYPQGAHPHLHSTAHPPTSVHPSWATQHHGQRDQREVPRSDSPLSATIKDTRERTTTTTLPHHPPQTSDPNTSNTANSKKQLALLEAQQRQQSVEAMVMSIDYGRKASVLRRIGRELPAYGAMADNIDNLSEVGDEGQEQTQIVTTRGPIIAVEGPNTNLLRVIGKAVEKALVELGDCEVKAWVGEGDIWDSEGGSSGKGNKNEDEKEKGKKGGEDVEMRDTITARGSSSPKSNSGKDSPSLLPTTTTKNPFPRYLDLMLSWHHKASELTKFVTAAFFSPSSSPSSSLLPSSRQPSRNSSRHPSHSPSLSTTGQQKLPKLPIALLPLGYSLTYSDRFACTIPIADSYGPVDHWQWMATLWRGIVGPDLTVYVEPVTEEKMMHEGQDRMHQALPVEVEVKGERLITVRVVVPAQNGQLKAEAVELDGEAEKQLAYEVGEWVRAGPFGVQGRGGVARGERGVRGQVQVGYETGTGREGGYDGKGW